MTTSTRSRTGLMRRAAAQALLAPSVHNTQPWQFAISEDHFELWADRQRQLPVLDPTGRQLMISLGCALFNARAALAGQGFEGNVQRCPDPSEPDLAARIDRPRLRHLRSPIADLDSVIAERQTNRRRYEEAEVPLSAVFQLVNAVTEEGARLLHVTAAEHRLALATLGQEADRLQNADPAYRAELRRWTTDDSQRRDGVPAMAVPHVTGEAHDDVPVRDFDTRGNGWLPSGTHSGVDQCWLLLGTDRDDDRSWLQAGEALQRLWLTATALGYVASIFSQIIEVPRLRAQLRTDLGLIMHPHVLLRIGQAPRTASALRRPLCDMLIQDTAAPGS